MTQSDISSLSKNARLEQEEFRITCLEESLREMQEDDQKNYGQVRDEVSVCKGDGEHPETAGRGEAEQRVHDRNEAEGTRGNRREIEYQAQSRDNVPNCLISHVKMENNGLSDSSMKSSQCSIQTWPWRAEIVTRTSLA
jgi:hypothetical protein